MLPSAILLVKPWQRDWLWQGSVRGVSPRIRQACFRAIYQTTGNIPYHHVHTAPPAVTDIRPDLPPILSQIVSRCLEKDPANRYQSAREILTEVRSTLVSAVGGDRSEGR